MEQHLYYNSLEYTTLTGSFEQIQSKEYCEILLHLLLWYKAESSASLLQSSVSHDLSEIILTSWFAAKKHFWLLMMKIIIFVETHFCQDLYW